MCYRLSLSFAYLSLVATKVCLVVSVIYGEWLVAGVIRHVEILLSNPSYLHDDVNKLNAFVWQLAMSLLCLIAGFVASISFIFTIILCNGLTKRQPGQIKAYLTFGFTLTTLTVTAAVVHMFAYDTKPARNTLIACGVYLFWLVIIRETYKSMQTATCD